MIEEYDGAEVVDAAGETIGTVEQSYVDERGLARFVKIKMGRLRVKHRLIPTDDVECTDDGLKVPYTSDLIESSPDASDSGETLEGEKLAEVRAYYAGDEETVSGFSAAGDDSAAMPLNGAPRSDTSAPNSEGDGGAVENAKRAIEQIGQRLPGRDSDADVTREGSSSGDIGQIRDRGDVIEVPIVEEELVKTPIVKEVLRIRKTPVATRETVSGDVRKEDIEVEQVGDVVTTDATREQG